MRIANTSALLALLVVGILGCDASDTSEMPSELQLENLLQTSLAEEFTPGREVVVSHVKIPPNTTMDRHWHPGEEFHYYLAGEVEIEIDGEPSHIGKPGTVGHVPFRKMHTAITGEEGAEVLVFRVHTEGEPVRYLEEGGTAER